MARKPTQRYLPAAHTFASLRLDATARLAEKGRDWRAFLGRGVGREGVYLHYNLITAKMGSIVAWRKQFENRHMEPKTAATNRKMQTCWKEKL
jgi:hypothetical protein